MSADTTMMIAMIPARLGSQRLKQKNLRQIEGVPLISHAIRKCLEAKVFDKVIVNSESDIFEKIATDDGAEFHHRPEQLGDNNATSEQYITEFLNKHRCDWLVQVHSIAPLLKVDEIISFSKRLVQDEFDVLLSVSKEQIECMYQGKPINFTLSEKTNSQDLTPVERVTWSITGWKRSTFLNAVNNRKCATYHGRVGTFPIDRAAGHIIKTEDDLRIAQALWNTKQY